MLTRYSSLGNTNTECHGKLTCSSCSLLPNLNRTEEAQLNWDYPGSPTGYITRRSQAKLRQTTCFPAGIFLPSALPTSIIAPKPPRVPTLASDFPKGCPRDEAGPDCGHRAVLTGSVIGPSVPALASICARAESHQPHQEAVRTSGVTHLNRLRNTSPFAVLYCASVPRFSFRLPLAEACFARISTSWTYPANMAYNSKFNPDRLPAHAEPEQVCASVSSLF